jgi:penicillin-binding protein 1A
MDEKTAVQLIDIMRGVIAEGTGQSIRTRFGIDADVAGKTGTTQANADGWFILMHKQLVAGAWVGFNDPRVRMRSSYWGQGGHNALLVVGDFYRQALRARLIDRNVRFARPPQENIFRDWLDEIERRIRGWGGEDAETAPPPRAPSRQARPAPDIPDEERESSGDEGNAIFRDVDEAVHAIREIEGMIRRGLGGAGDDARR